MIWTAGMAPPSSFVISPRCSIRGKWRLVMEMGAFSISLAQRGTIPCRLAARGNTPMPSKRLPRVSGPPSALFTGPSVHV